MSVVALLHPGEMGASIGAALARSGHVVRWPTDGRSGATRRRADAAGLHAVPTLGDAVAEAEVVLAVCPPAAALDVAAAVAETGFAEVYVDANAVSPHTAERVAECVELAGARFVDGDVIGGPVAPGSGTRLYLSGPDAAEVAGLFAPDDPSVVVLGADPTAASTLKMCYAAWTKGTAALVLAIAAVAEQAGLGEALAAEWARSQPDLARRLDAATGAGRKAWRFAGEMDEVAATFAAAGLPPGFASAAGDVYRRLERFKDATATPAELVDELLDGFHPPAAS